MTGHDANSLPEDTLYIKSPEETKTLVEAGVTAARTKYAGSAAKSSLKAISRNYRLATGLDTIEEDHLPEPPPEPPAEDVDLGFGVDVDIQFDPTPDDSWVKQDIVDWLTSRGVEANTTMLKADLLGMVDQVLSPAPTE